MPYRIIRSIGRRTLCYAHTLHLFAIFLARALKTLFCKPLKIRHVINCMMQIGISSLPTILLTGSFSGLALALQSYVGFEKFGTEGFIGALVSLAMIREMGPVLTGLMVTGRAGSAMAAELSTMHITEQIDALQTLRIDPYQYLVVPRIVAGLITMPCLALFAMICGIAGGYFFCVVMAGLNSETYLWAIKKLVNLPDLLGGVCKAACFGFIMGWVGSFYGFNATGGARGVGSATTKSVVSGSILILIANFFLSSLFF